MLDLDYLLFALCTAKSDGKIKQPNIFVPGVQMDRSKNKYINCYINNVIIFKMSLYDEILDEIEFE